jgi:hypothetical protein
MESALVTDSSNLRKVSNTLAVLTSNPIKLSESQPFRHTATISFILIAMNSVPGLLSFSSIALSYSPDLLAEAGKYAAVPFIIGDEEDEGQSLLFSSPISQLWRSWLCICRRISAMML